MDRPNDFNDCAARFPNDVQQPLKQMLRTIKKAAPEAKEKISYRPLG